MIEFPSQTAPDTVSGSQLRLGGSKRCEGRPAVILRDFFFRLLGGDPRIPHEPPLSGCRKMPVTRRIATLTNATGFCNAISVLILRREPSPLPVAKPTGFTTVALTALACKIAPICLIPYLGLFINGLPVFTFELKNNLTKQTVEDAVEQYKRDRAPREKLFEFGRSVAHFAVDDHEVRFCTHLKGKTSWFLPFNQGWNNGAGNPPNADGLKTDYLWTRLLTRDGLTNILENYAQVVETKDEKTGKKRKVQIWPRYHQLDVVRRLLADIRRHGAGKRYLIQHSAGSGNLLAFALEAITQLLRASRNGMTPTGQPNRLGSACSSQAAKKPSKST